MKSQALSKVGILNSQKRLRFLRRVKICSAFCVLFFVSSRLGRLLSQPKFALSFRSKAGFQYETLKECLTDGPTGSSAAEKQLSAYLQRSLLDFPRSSLNEIQMKRNRRVFFAMNLHNAAEVIPLLLSTVLKVCLFFFASPSGGGECYISIYESGSTDATRALPINLQ